MPFQYIKKGGFLMKRILSLVLAALLLLACAASALAATSYETCLNPAGAADLKMTLTNLDLDGTLQPGMYEGKKIVVASASGDHSASLREFAKIFKELTGGESFETNVQLALNNARCAARIAAALCELKKAE